MQASNAITHVPKSGDEKATMQFSINVTPSEKTTIERIAASEMRSRSSASRMLILRGLAQYEQESLIAD